MSEIKKLYEITLYHDATDSLHETLFVIAKDPYKAENLAISVQENNCLYAKHIEKVAENKPYGHPNQIVI